MWVYRVPCTVNRVGVGSIAFAGLSHPKSGNAALLLLCGLLCSALLVSAVAHAVLLVIAAIQSIRCHYPQCIHTCSQHRARSDAHGTHMIIDDETFRLLLIHRTSPPS